MIASRVTFYVANQGIPGWQLNELKTIAGLFRSVIVLTNLSRGKEANVEQSLKAMSVKNCAGDLCQLVIEGLDAELACMVFSEYFSEHHHLIATTHSQKRMAKEDFRQLPFEKLAVPTRWSFVDEGAASKIEVLTCAALQTNPQFADELLAALQAREAISSTLISDRIALPHIIHDKVDKLTLVVHHTNCVVPWADERPNPEIIITLLVPVTKERDILLACTRLTRWLLIEENQRHLLNNNDEFLIKVILYHVMASYTPM
ncbi:PTS sugar transporter subunit IIA [Vibrio sp. S4M6]|uniref:PTS sugar transporter subunit IIA n=1 Tax=Vibrio sinus TaxID=2946865 RepID=UPI00202AB48A|nr:PTS sugar transporter subunit IIA [Vibrio sinus]MCL9780173.1 PTS sugar transporter subunit IIA [Vibrio sinus]